MINVIVLSAMPLFCSVGLMTQQAREPSNVKHLQLHRVFGPNSESAFLVVARQHGAVTAVVLKLDFAHVRSRKTSNFYLAEGKQEFCWGGAQSNYRIDLVLSMTK